MNRLRRSALALIVIVFTGLGLGCGPSAKQAETAPDSSTTASDLLAPSSTTAEVPYVPTSQPVVDRMLELAAVTADDVVYDLGSGDGRIVIRAAERYGARGVGIEIDEALVETARRNAEAAGVADRVTFRQGDLFEADISEATVVAVYLLPTVNLKLRPKLLRELAPGTRVVSHDFDMDDWQYDERVEVGSSALFLWTIPETVPDHLQDTP